MSMMLLTKEERLRRAEEARQRLHPLRAIGDGPWLVLAYCPAEMHNTLNAARGTRVPSGKRCLCPQACHLLAEHGKRQTEIRRLRRMGLPVDPLPRPPRRPRNGRPQKQETMQASSSYFTNVLDSVAPDLNGAACRSALNMVFFDAALEGRLTAEAKDVCRGCPVKAACAAWVKKAETPAGAWGGVYGGLSVTDRKRLKEYTA